MRLLILTSLLTFFFLHSASSQTLRQYVKEAEVAFAKKDYYSAYVRKRQAHEIEPNNVEYTYKLAEAARLYSAFTMAEKYYQEVADNNRATDFPETDYWLAFVKQRLGKYEEALALYQIYLSEHNNDNAQLDTMALKNIEASNWAIEALKNKDTALELIHLGSEVNTNFSEFGAHQEEDSLYYTSLRFIGYSEATEPAKPYSKVLISEDDATGVPDSLLNDPLLHTANTAFNGAGDRLFYTLCDYINGMDIRCDLYYRDVVDGVYGIAQKLPEPINMTGVTNTQPHVGYDPISAREVLYFVSDRAGGAGRRDIWFSYIVDRDNFTAPENLTALNTPFNESSPFYHRASNTIYFSTEGYPGFGGL